MHKRAGGDVTVAAAVKRKKDRRPLAVGAAILEDRVALLEGKLLEVFARIDELRVELYEVTK